MPVRMQNDDATLTPTSQYDGPRRKQGDVQGTCHADHGEILSGNIELPLSEIWAVPFSMCQISALLAFEKRACASAAFLHRLRDFTCRQSCIPVSSCAF